MVAKPLAVLALGSVAVDLPRFAELAACAPVARPVPFVVRHANKVAKFLVANVRDPTRCPFGEDQLQEASSQQRDLEKN